MSSIRPQRTVESRREVDLERVQRSSAQDQLDQVSVERFQKANAELAAKEQAVADARGAARQAYVAGSSRKERLGRASGT